MSRESTPVFRKTTGCEQSSSHESIKCEERTRRSYRVLPPLLDAEFQRLKCSIDERSVEVPIVVDQIGNVIDGFHRQRACEELGVFCPQEIRQFDSEAQRFELILNLNCRRRQLNREQKRKLIEAYLIRDPQIADNFLGELIGVSKNTVAEVRQLLESTCQIDRLVKLRGKDGKVRRRQKRIVANTANEARRAAKIVGDLPEKAEGKLFDFKSATRSARRNRRRIENELQRKRLEREKLTKPHDDDAIKIFHCPFQELNEVAAIEPHSVRLLLTDPPYGNEFCEQWGELAAFAKRVLTPGGLFVAYTGQYRLGEKMRMLGQQLRYQWLATSVWNGDAVRMHPLKLTSKSIPIVIYSNGEWEPDRPWCDLLQFDSKEKNWHQWQRPLAEIEKLVNYFSSNDDLVVDPCGGGFTTAVACKRLGRRCISCDVDKMAVIKGQLRLELECQTILEAATSKPEPVPYSFGASCEGESVPVSEAYDV